MGRWVSSVNVDVLVADATLPIPINARRGKESKTTLHETRTNVIQHCSANGRIETKNETMKGYT